MARLLKRLPEEFKEMSTDKKYGGLWNDENDILYAGTDYALEEKAFEALKKRAIFVWNFQVADSYAYYEVAKLKPLQLVWIPYMDKWEAPAYVIRGLSTEDVEADIRWEQQFIKNEVK